MKKNNTSVKKSNHLSYRLKTPARIITITIFILAIVYLSCKGPYSPSERNNPYDPQIPGKISFREISPVTKELNAVLPSWSPDESKIVYQSGERSEEKIIVINADGTERKIQTPDKDNYSECHPKWSPVDNRIAYIDNPNSNVFVRLYNDTLRTQLTFEKNYWYPTWASDGCKIACLGEPHLTTRSIWIIDLDNHQKQAIYEDSQLLLICDWSVNNEILFVTRKTGDHALFFLDVDSGKVRPFPLKDKIIFGSFSADGQKIIYTTFKNNRFEVWSAYKNGDAATVIITENIYPELRQVLFTNISSDGLTLLFEASLFPSTTIFDRGSVTNIYVAKMK
jgi:Tol biopolymer transport system component